MENIEKIGCVPKGTHPIAVFPDFTAFANLQNRTEIPRDICFRGTGICG